MVQDSLPDEKDEISRIQCIISETEALGRCLSYRHLHILRFIPGLGGRPPLSALFATWIGIHFRTLVHQLDVDLVESCMIPITSTSPMSSVANSCRLKMKLLVRIQSR